MSSGLNNKFLISINAPYNDFVQKQESLPLWPLHTTAIFAPVFNVLRFFLCQKLISQKLTKKKSHEIEIWYEVRNSVPGP